MVSDPNDQTAGDEAARWDASVMVDLYKGDDGRLLTYELLEEEVEAQIASDGLGSESWSGGAWNFDDYLTESVQAGVYDVVEVEMIVETRYTDDRTVWTYGQMRDGVFPAQIAGVDMSQFLGGELSFTDWLAESCNVGIYRKVEVVWLRDEDGTVFTEDSLRTTTASLDRADGDMDGAAV